MKRVGLYVFTDMVKERTTKKREGYFDGQNYIGLRYIASEIDKSQYELSYVSKDTINSVDFALVSLTSYYDILNIINELHGKKITAKVIVGGAGCNNIDLLRGIADIAVVGRGEGMINDVLAGNTPHGIYDKATNCDLKKQIEIRALKKFISIDDPILGQYDELSIGCKRKCFFCEYSWKNKLCTKSDIYHSGLADRETMLEEVDWGRYVNKDLVTAVDGIDYATRKIINKNISNETIKAKIEEIKTAARDYYSLKLYCLLGYPFQNSFEPEELLDTIVSADTGSKRCNVMMVSPHFMPMPFTPMECESVNMFNFRKKIERYDFSRWQKGNIKVFWPYSQSSSPVSAVEATILHRATLDDADTIKRILCSAKYRSLTCDQKISVAQKAFGQYLGEVQSVAPYVKRTHATEAAKVEYLKRKGG